MKGLMFNLLDTLAREAGCCQKAWELVAEFAAAEAVLEAFQDDGAGCALPPSHLFDVPIEAMVRCLAREPSTPEPLLSEAPSAWDAFNIAAYEDWLELDSLEETLPDLYDSLPHARGDGGLSSSAFSELEPLESWPPEGDPDDELFGSSDTPSMRPRKH